MVLHTATSGAVAALDELRLVVEEGGQIAALGATRVNIGYLTGLSAEALIEQCVEAAGALDWSLGWREWPLAFDQQFPNKAASCRMLFEMAAADGAARAAGVSLSCYLGGPTKARVPTNQTLFRCEDELMLQRAQAYVNRGFKDLKLRVGFGSFADDVRRLHLLRAKLGFDVQLSIDANGSWPAARQAEFLAALVPLQLRYVEQPCPPGETWVDAPMPLMLDESLSDMAAVERLATLPSPAPVWAHLKLAKLGGVDRLVQAGGWLRDSATGFMVGQMNEGVVSTLAAAHAAVALGSEMMELYGADGLQNDPAGGLIYADGCVHLPAGPGLGLLHHAATGSLVWEGSAKLSS
jgi:L-alanine-DL-glutamate epimerase-like enolase superfamily enzyme